MNNRPTEPAGPLSKDERFFFDHMGYSYKPPETKQEGLTRCAREAAVAEQRAREAGFSFDWSTDPEIDSSDFSDEPNPWQLWQCIARDGAGNIVASLHGIDFGRDGEPWGNSYRRCVEAELALEGLPSCEDADRLG